MDWKRYNNNLKKRFSKENLHREFNEIRKDTTKRDIFILLLLPIIATIIELLPSDFQYVLRLNVQNPSWWQFLTSAFTHQYFQHYFNNISLFLLLAFVQLVIASKMDVKKRYFYLLGITFFLLPILSSAYDVLYSAKLFTNMQTICGSSGIVSALLGFLPIMWMGYFSKSYGRKMVNLKLMLISMFYIGLLMLITYAFSTSIVQITIFSAAIVIFTYLYRKDLRYALKGINEALRKNLILYYILITMPIFFIGTPLILFPITLQQGGSGVDVIVHYIGAIFGCLLSYMFFRNLGAEKQPFSYHFKPKTGRFLDRFRM